MLKHLDFVFIGLTSCEIGAPSFRSFCFQRRVEVCMQSQPRSPVPARSWWKIFLPRRREQPTFTCVQGTFCRGPRYFSRSPHASNYPHTKFAFPFYLCTCSQICSAELKAGASQCCTKSDLPNPVTCDAVVSPRLRKVHARIYVTAAFHRVLSRDLQIFANFNIHSSSPYSLPLSFASQLRYIRSRIRTMPDFYNITEEEVQPKVYSHI